MFQEDRPRGSALQACSAGPTGLKTIIAGLPKRGIRRPGATRCTRLVCRSLVSPRPGCPPATALCLTVAARREGACAAPQTSRRPVERDGLLLDPRMALLIGDLLGVEHRSPDERAGMREDRWKYATEKSGVEPALQSSPLFRTCTSC